MSSWLNSTIHSSFPNILILEVLQAQPSQQSCAACGAWSAGAYQKHPLLRDVEGPGSVQSSLNLVNTSMILTDRSLKIRWRGNAHEPGQQQSALGAIETL